MIIAIISSHIFVPKPAPDEEEIDIPVLFFAFSLKCSVCTGAVFYLHKNRFAIG